MKRLLALALVALVACSQAPDAGVITEKGYDDPDEWYQCMSTGTPGEPYYSSCGYTIRHYDEEHWLLRLDDGEDNGWVRVPEFLWTQARVGQFYDSKTGEIRPR